MTTKLRRALLSPPGDTIQETIDAIGMSQIELAERMGKDKKNINRMIKGEEPVSQYTAVLLERVLGIPANFWIEREKEYRRELMQIEADEVLEKELTWLKEFPLSAMMKLGWIRPEKNKIALMKQMLSFFGIGSSQQWKEIYLESSLSVSFRLSLAHTSHPGAISAWLRKGELLMKEQELPGYDRKRFIDALEAIKQLVKDHPEDFKEQLLKECADAGVGVVFTPCLPHAPINGAFRWIRNGSIPLIQLSCRYKTNDTFWFTFFHEAGHLLKHGKKQVFLEDVRGIRHDKAMEEEANIFAAEQLFSMDAFDELRSEERFDDAILYQYAEKHHTHPAIIAGRLEHENLVHRSRFHHLKIRVDV